VCALDHVSITLRTGETLGLVGESGSGKTTLARIVAGLVRPDSGELMLDGSVLPARVETRTRTQTSAVQSVFQNPHSALNRAHRVRTLLGRAVGKLAGLRGAAREQRVRTLLDAVRLPASRLTARARELSGGQQQRVAIARAFAGEPRIVICDEPTSALDVSVQAAVLNLLVELQRTQHASYLFISHDLGVVRYVADRIAVLYRGQLVESGPADEIFARPRHPYTEALLSVASAGRVVTRGQHVESGAAPNTGSGPVSSASAGQVAVSGSTSEAATASQSATVTDTRSTASAAPRSSATGCVYAASCASSLGAQCERERPADIRISDAHTVRCHLYRTSDTAA
jgi:peptide/nickel transport system ATP-binding protein